MRTVGSILAIGISAVCAAGYVGLGQDGLGITQAAARGLSAPVHAVMQVERTGKSDRLPVLTVTQHMKSAPATQKPAQALQPLPEGCDPALSPLASATLASIPARCLA